MKNEELHTKRNALKPYPQHPGFEHPKIAAIWDVTYPISSLDPGELYSMAPFHDRNPSRLKLMGPSQLCFTPNSSEYEISLQKPCAVFHQAFQTKNRMGVHVWNPDHVAMQLVLYPINDLPQLSREIRSFLKKSSILRHHPRLCPYGVKLPWQP